MLHAVAIATTLLVVALGSSISAHADVVGCPSPVPDAFACGNLLLFDAKFQLTDDEGVHRLGPFAARVQIGNGSLGPSGAQYNWGPFLRRGPFDPNDPTKDYIIHLFNGPVTAQAPPPDSSLYAMERGRFFDFYNFSTDPVDIDVFWNATYSMLAKGDHSGTGIQVEEQTKNRRTGQQLTDKLLLNVHLVNDNEKNLVHANGNFEVSIAAGTLDAKGRVIPGITVLRLGDVVTSRAVVPEPSSLFLLGTGLISLSGVLRKKLLTRS